MIQEVTVEEGGIWMPLSLTPIEFQVLLTQGVWQGSKVYAVRMYLGPVIAIYDFVLNQRTGNGWRFE